MQLLEWLRFLLDFNFFFQKDENKPPITTVFVGNISDRAPDTMIRQVLQVSRFAVRVAVILHRIVHFKVGSWHFSALNSNTVGYFCQHMCLDCNFWEFWLNKFFFNWSSDHRIHPWILWDDCLRTSLSLSVSLSLSHCSPLPFSAAHKQIFIRKMHREPTSKGMHIC